MVRHLYRCPLRWADLDLLGHVNNVTYYSYFDTIVNGYLIEQGALDIANSAVIGLVVETQCNYFKPIAFPDSLTGALRVARLKAMGYQEQKRMTSASGPTLSDGVITALRS